MPTVQIVGLPPGLQETAEAQRLALELLPYRLSRVEGLDVEAHVVTPQFLTDGVVRERLRLTVHVFDLFVRKARTAAVRTRTAEVIRDSLLSLCERLGYEVESISVCLGAFVAAEHGYASYPE